MRRLVGACVVILAMGCGGGGGVKTKHPDAATNGDGNGAADHAPEASGSGGGAGSDAAPGDPSSTDAPGNDTNGNDTNETDVNETGADLASEMSDAGSDAASDGDGADAEVASPRLVTVAFTGLVETVAGTPLGFDSTARLAPVSGSFTYDLRLLDDEPADPLRGKFQRAGTTAFTFMVKGHTITGSGQAIVETENLNPDTFRFLDGPQGDTVVRTMKLDGADDPALVLSIAITDSSGAMLTSDALPDPFPTINIADADGGFNISHTFSLKDGGGTLLMQLGTLVSQ